MCKNPMITLAALAVASSMAIAQDRSPADDQQPSQPAQVIIKDTDDGKENRQQQQTQTERRTTITTERDNTGTRTGTGASGSVQAGESSEQRTTVTTDPNATQTGGAMQAGERQTTGANAQMQAKAGQHPEAKEIVRHLTSGNQFEIQLSQLAEQKSQDPQVKQFAQQMRTDHTQAQQQVKQFAQQRNIQVSDSELMPAHEAKLTELRQKDGAAFDRGFAICQAAHHVESVLMHQYLANEYPDPQVKQMAQQMLPKLQQHQQHAFQLAQSQVGGSGTAIPAGGRMEGSMNHDRGDMNTGGTMNRSTEIRTNTDASGSINRSGGVGASGSVDTDTDRRSTTDDKKSDPHTPEPSPQNQLRQGSQTGAGNNADQR